MVQFIRKTMKCRVGDINRPQIVFNGAGWVKLYCDDFSVVNLNGVNQLLCNSTLYDFKTPIYYLYLFGCLAISGDVGILESGVRDICNFYGLNNLTITKGIDVRYLNVVNCELSQNDIYTQVLFDYNSNILNRSREFQGNTIPDQTTIDMITEMTTNRGWTIYYDTI